MKKRKYAKKKRLDHNILITGHEQSHDIRSKGMLNLLALVGILGLFLFSNGITGMVISDPSQIELAQNYFTQFGLGGIIMIAILITIHHHHYHNKIY